MDSAGKPVATSGMWQTIGTQWQELSVKAVTRWEKADAQALKDTGGERERLIDVVAAAYEMDDFVAESEVDAWALSLNATE